MPVPATRQDLLEGAFTARRIQELELHPVNGNFDAAHLREINRRIFQDLPALGYTEYSPGVYRPQVSALGEHPKQRRLATVPSTDPLGATSIVAYSRMDTPAQQHLDAILRGAKPEVWRALTPPQFSQRLTQLYAELDYAHPFRDGNSRTLRVYTRQLGRDARFDVAWRRTGVSQERREGLYIARDRAVNTLYLARNPTGQLRAEVTRNNEQFKAHPGLEDILTSITRPSKVLSAKEAHCRLAAESFKTLPHDQFLREFPDYAGAVEHLNQAARHAREHYAKPDERDYFIAQARARLAQQIAQGREWGSLQREASESPVGCGPRAEDERSR